MTIDEFQDRSVKLGQGLQRLLDDMYAAIDEDTPLDEVHKLLERANHKIKQFENLYSESSEVWQQNLRKGYLELIEEAQGFKKQLKEKYLEKK
ncbi:hypothetical protein [Flavobacterium sp. HNIBRBA15423]|uniref:hypothetical protein n=1 Tax=Flavobacterium sp. HNIBRBA15423 TaxID=3458683 RepID=UPI004044A391